MTLVSIMPMAVKETVDGFEDKKTAAVTPDAVGRAAIGDIEAAVDRLYDGYDKAMVALLGKLSGIGEAGE